MDKARFIEVAPIYYALAIAAYLRDKPHGTSRSEIRKEYSYDDHEAGETWYYLDNDKLFELGIEWLSRQHMIYVVAGDFGPALIEPSVVFDEQLSELCTDRSLPFHLFSRTGSSIS